MGEISTLLLFVLGFFVLVQGARYLVRGAVHVANLFKVSRWFIGVVIVSIGTSIPELSINLASALEGNDVGIATILGSNIFNVFATLGVMALISPVIMSRARVFKDLLMFIGVMLFAGFIIQFPVLGDPSVYGVTSEESILLLGLFVLWLILMINHWDESNANTDFEVVTIFTAMVMVFGGIIGVFFGGQWVVDGAVLIAAAIGVSPAVIGFSLVALGTSLPEFVVSIVALRQGMLGIAVGNILGSSIFNVLGVLGITAFVKEINILDESIAYHIAFMIFSAVCWFVFMLIGKKYTLGRFEGLIFLFLYVYFIVSLI